MFYMPEPPIDPPEPRDYDREEEIWLERSDLEHDRRHEDKILGRDF